MNLLRAQYYISGQKTEIFLLATRSGNYSFGPNQQPIIILNVIRYGNVQFPDDAIGKKFPNWPIKQEMWIPSYLALQYFTEQGNINDTDDFRVCIIMFKAYKNNQHKK